MITEAISPLRQRMMEYMSSRKLGTYVSGDVGRGPPRRPPAVLRRSCAARRQGCIQGLSGATARGRLGGLRQGAVRWAPASVALSVALHPPHCDLQSPARVRRNRLLLK